MSLFVVDLADSVDVYTWDDLFGGRADFLDYFPIFYRLSMFDVHC